MSKKAASALQNEIRKGPKREAPFLAKREGWNSYFAGLLNANLKLLVAKISKKE